MTYQETGIELLVDKARQIRRDIIDMIYRVQSGHIGGSLSIVEILICLYNMHMNVDPDNPSWEGRDRFVLSKGHNAPALYAVLADKGFYPREYLMSSFRRINGTLQGHPDMKKTPGVDMTSGSLGVGLSAACGMAMGAKIKNSSYRVYAVIGDGETNEGQIWEAAATAAHYRLDNLTLLIDCNKLQNDGDTCGIKGMEPMKDKWEAFGWNVLEIDGHDLSQIHAAVDGAKEYKGKPTVIICRTIKGKGVSFMENSIKFHGASPTDEEYRKAMQELA